MADSQTIKHYSSNASEYIKFYESKSPETLYDLARVYFKPLGLTLDIGAGTGRDAFYLTSLGFPTTAIEPVPEFGKYINEKYPDIKVIPDELPKLDRVKGHSFANIFSCGVLSHLPANELLSALYRMLEVLQDDGCLLLSWRNSTNQTDREGERLYSNFSGHQVIDILTSYGCETLHYRHEYSDPHRKDVSFFNLVVKKKAKALQGLAKIQSIISNDSKTSTYKFALIRALAEIAQYESFCAKYNKDVVEIPLNKISKLWVYYYWKLALEGIRQGANPNLAIYAKLKPYAERLQMPLRKYYSEVATDDLTVALEKLIESTIVKQPVKYITEDSKPVFARAGELLVVPADFWRDLVLFGHWVEKSLLIEWAQMTYTLNNKEKSLGYYLDMLLFDFDRNRDQSVINDVRTALAEHGLITKCCWTDRPLVQMEIDHIIPFSSGYIEHLWNLVPADKKVNNQKRDRIPTPDLLARRFEKIRDCWVVYQSKYPERFAREFHEGLNLDVSDMMHSVAKDALIERASHQVNIRGGVYWRG